MDSPFLVSVVTAIKDPAIPLHNLTANLQVSIAQVAESPSEASCKQTKLGHNRPNLQAETQKS